MPRRVEQGPWCIWHKAEASSWSISLRGMMRTANKQQGQNNGGSEAWKWTVPGGTVWRTSVASSTWCHAESKRVSRSITNTVLRWTCRRRQGRETKKVNPAFSPMYVNVMTYLDACFLVKGPGVPWVFSPSSVSDKCDKQISSWYSLWEEEKDRKSQSSKWWQFSPPLTHPLRTYPYDHWFINREDKAAVGSCKGLKEDNIPYMWFNAMRLIFNHHMHSTSSRT